MAISPSFSTIMDELACRSSSTFSHQFPASFSVPGGQHPVLELEYYDVPEQWLEDDDDGVEKFWDGTATTVLGNGDTPSAGNGVPDKPPAVPAPKGRRGRKPGRPRTAAGPVLSHVEAERQRRDKLNRRFCDLRTAVPTVSNMDRASLLADATAYIAELRGRAERLEVEVRQAAAAPSAAATAGPAEAIKEKLEAAALDLTTTAATPHAAARLMVALCSLDVPVQHAYVCRVGGTTVQDAVVDVPVALRDEVRLRAALLRCLQGSG